ncbi:DUF2971 domain-containing protein [Vibrio metschnikovii]|uniref:DUF2971 domain-containing protein n=1 Tax=Vibrio metschnikovii TaxID=28172 RepID=UPI001C2FE155|nr:DUF2971 domain-containing protein [Vibrio metschnikovii]
MVPREFGKDDIFKYGDLASLARTLNDETLGFSELSQYNDPFESEFSTFLHISDANKRESFLASNVSVLNKPDIWVPYNRVKDWINSYFSSQRVTCFSQSPVEPLMWAHYADKHKGVCYWFDKTVFDKRYTSGDVVYSSSLPKLHLDFGKTKSCELKRHLDNIILTKSQSWAYEKEHRFFTSSNETVHKFNPHSLKFVILGMRSADEIDQAHRLVHSFNQRNRTNVRVLHANMSSDRYEMEINSMVTISSFAIHCPEYEECDEFDLWKTGI